MNLQNKVMPHSSFPLFSPAGARDGVSQSSAGSRPECGGRRGTNIMPSARGAGRWSWNKDYFYERWLLKFGRCAGRRFVTTSRGDFFSATDLIQGNITLALQSVWRWDAVMWATARQARAGFSNWHKNKLQNRLARWLPLTIYLVSCSPPSLWYWEYLFLEAGILLFSSFFLFFLILSSSSLTAHQSRDWQVKFRMEPASCVFSPISQADIFNVQASMHGANDKTDFFDWMGRGKMLDIIFHY